MTYKALLLVLKKHKAYSRYKDTHHPAYRKAARAADEAIKSAKKKFESQLASNIKNDSKSFCAYVNSRCKARVKVGTLVAENGEMVTEAVEMSEQLNEYFTSVFTRENLSQMPSADTVNTDTDTVYRSDINIDPVSVLNKLNRLRSDKAAGPDELSPRVLKEITEEICEPLTIILQRSIDEGSIPDDWRNANISPIYKKGGKAQAANYRPGPPGIPGIPGNPSSQEFPREFPGIAEFSAGICGNFKNFQI